MATSTQADIPVTTDWVDIVTVNGSLASADLAIQNKGFFPGDTVFVVFGGSEPTASLAGTRLDAGDSVNGNAAAIWVRGDAAAIGVTLL